MTGLRLMNELSDPAAARECSQEHIFTRQWRRRRSCAQSPWRCRRRAQSPKFAPTFRFPPAPYLDRKARAVPDLNEVWSYINPYMLFGRHLGFHGNFEKALGERDPQRAGIVQRRWRKSSRSPQFHEGRRGLAVFRSRARRQLDSPLRARRRQPVQTFHFGASESDGLCLSDYILCRETASATISRCSWSPPARASAKIPKKRKQRGEYLLVAWPAGSGDRNRGRLRRMAASPHPRRLGFPRSAHHDDAGAFHFALSRQTLQLRLSRVPEPGRSSEASGSCCVPKISACISRKA